jgi:hypothetical protein
MGKDVMSSNKYKRLGNIASAIGGLVSILAIISFIIVANKDNEKIMTLNSDIEQISYQYNELTEKAVQDSIEIAEINDVIIDFTMMINNNDLDSFKDFFSERIDRFFLLENISSQDAYYQMRWYMKTYPDSKIEYNISEVSIEKKQSSYYVYLPLTNYKDKNSPVEIISEIRLNKDKKIYHIRDYFANNE